MQESHSFNALTKAEGLKKKDENYPRHDWKPNWDVESDTTSSKLARYEAEAGVGLPTVDLVDIAKS